MSTANLHITEATFQAQVVQYAKLRGWMTYHTHDSRRSEPGFPDLVMVRPASLERGEGRMVFAELKTLRGRLSEDQRRWIHALKSTGVRVCVWRPSDESWRSIQEVLG